MNCAWKELLSVLPPKIRKNTDQLGRDHGQEIRLRCGSSSELITSKGSIPFGESISREDLDFVINTASHYSPWAASTVSKAYLTAPGGHRIGLCGDVVLHNGEMTGIRSISSLCIRIARDFPGIAAPLRKLTGSALIIGAPGWGKTTLLRDLIRILSEHSQISVVDERGEVFPSGFAAGKHVDVLSGCPKPTGIPLVLKTMGPAYIAVDEVTDQEDCLALINAANCGVQFLATAHASSIQDLKSRPVYCELLKNRVFETCIIMDRNKSWTLERIKL